MMLAIERSSRCRVSEQSSTEQQHRHLSGKARNVSLARGEARCPRHTAEAEHRGALHIGAQPQPVDQPRVDAGGGYPRHRHEEEMVDVSQREASPRQPVQHGSSAKLGRYAQEGVVGLSKGIQGRIFRERQGQVSALDAHRPVQIVEASGVEVSFGQEDA